MPAGICVGDFVRLRVESGIWSMPQGVSAVLESWLASATRPSDGATRFEISDVVEIEPRIAEVEARLTERLREERFHPVLLTTLVEALGWIEAQEAIQEGMPSIPNVRKGVVGEVIAAQCLEEFDGFVVPVKKLRSMLAAGDSLHGTDVLAFKLTKSGSIGSACYTEAKLRTGRDARAAVEAEGQLADDLSLRLPSLLLFVANQLCESGDPIARALADYMRRRRAGDDVDEFRVHLTWDAASWAENVLTRLQEAEERLTPLHVCCVRVAGLDSLIQRVYANLGFALDADDD
jgi:hypothetical protein